MPIHKMDRLKQIGKAVLVWVSILLLAYTAEYNVFSVDYNGEEQAHNLPSEVTKLLFDVDLSSAETILSYQLHEIDTERTANGYEITPNGEIIYDGERVLAEAIRLEIEDIPEWQPTETEEDTVVYIYHTHTHEAYNPQGYDYKEVEQWRTKDNNYNVVAVGTALTCALEERGITVIHDTTDYELNDYGGAYPRSLNALRVAEEEYHPDIWIDIHRNAYFENAEKSRAFSYDGQNMAYLMCVIGTGENYTEKPEWKENYKLARKITDVLNEEADGICYEPSVWEGRYNQQISTDAVLIEVGHNMNTIDEAVASMEYLARALAAIIGVEK